MNSLGVMGRVAAGAAGAMVLVGVAGAAFADDPEYGDDDVNVNVSIGETAEPGTLSMTVASNSTGLTESGTTATTRTFTGQLPTVTVTDSRVFPERLDPGAYWYVLGSSSSFVGDASQPAIDPANLGWTPKLVGGTDEGEVIAGDPVAPVLDTAQAPDNVGLVDRELLAAAVSSQGNTPPGTWTVGADLKLKTPITVAPGNYTALLTLSLFEDIDG
jgi:hypothetical protein